jgi:DNA-binding transcriptional LysR family regulator
MAVELRQIRVCLEVARHQAIRRAAGTLNIDEAAVSRTVRSLEDALGVSIFERFSGGVRVTDAGQRFLQDAQAAIDLIDRATANAGSAGRGEIGMLRLGMVWSAAAGRAHELITRFRDALPGVGLTLTERPAVDLATALLNRSLDVALLIGDLLPRNLSLHRLWSERLYFAVSALEPEREAVGWDLLASRSLLLTAAEDPNSVQRLAFEDGGPKFQTQPHNCSREGILGLVALGAGVAVTCESATLIPVPGVRFKPIQAEHAQCTVCAAWLDENDNPALRRFISLIRRRYPSVRRGSVRSPDPMAYSLPA